MPRITVSEFRTVAAPATVAYELIADYRTGHPSILPSPYFGRLDVLAGGYGAGTRIRFEMHAFGRTNVGEAEVTEPVPGRELRETMPDGLETTFLVEPLGPRECRVTITTTWERTGLRGWIERLLVPSFMHKVYAAELEQLERVAGERLRAP